MPRIKAAVLSLALTTSVASAYIACPLAVAADKIAAASSSMSASELANQVAAAYGGMAKIKEMLNRGSRSHGKLKSLSSLSSASNVFDCELVTKGSKMRIEMEVIGQLNVVAYDGKNGWTQLGDWVSKSTDKTVERIADELKHGLNALEMLDDPTYKLEVLPQKKINDKTYDVLKLTPADGKWTIFYIDPLTRLVERSDFMGLDTEQGIEALKTIDYSDYRSIMGFPTPFKLTEYISNRKTQETIIDAVTIDDTISDKFFQMPEETRYSRLQHGPVSIPFEYAGSEIVISARINNGIEAKFMVDTGASQTVIDKSTAKEIGPLNEHTFTVTSGAKALPANYTKLNKMQLGDLDLENLVALVTDLSPFAASIGQQPAGLIGANILRRFLVTIDYQDRKLTLADPHDVQIPPGAIVVPTSPIFGSTALVVDGLLDNKQAVNFLVDTGAGFNNLPYSLAKSLNAGTVLPVGQICGLDGLRTLIGSIKLKNLKLGAFNVNDPVFALQPDKSSKTSAGLFSANSLGILGNPVWSKTRLTIDYRNERLIIEIPPDRQVLDNYMSQVDDIDKAYLRNKNIDEAARNYEKLMLDAQKSKTKAIEALCIARLASLYGDRFAAQKESKWLDLASREYERAGKLAAESRNKTIEGQILSQWAMLYLNAPRNNTDLISAQNLLKKALTRSPSDASIYAALGSAMLKTEKTSDVPARQMGVSLIDRALLLDPSNWQALWAKYKLLESEKRTKDMALLVAQMTRYYPDYPQVKELLAKRQKDAAKEPAKTNAAGPKHGKNK